MTRLYIPQRSEDWFRMRLGKVTSTRLHTVAHGTLEAQTKLLDLMEAELEDPDEHILRYLDQFNERTPAAIKLGREREDWLRARFELLFQHEHNREPDMDLPGFVEHDSVQHFGSSPDWLECSLESVGEGKVRTDAQKHYYAIKRGLLPEDKAQVYAHMMCTGWERAHYVSFCPEWEDEASRLHIVDVVADKTYMAYLYAELRRFLEHFNAGTRPSVKQSNSGIPSFFD